jgi:hypothetical protein
MAGAHFGSLLCADTIVLHPKMASFLLLMLQVMWAKNFPASEFGYGGPRGYVKLSSFSQQVQYVAVASAAVARCLLCSESSWFAAGFLRARRGGVVDLQQRDPSLGLSAMFEQHFLFTVNESLNSSKALVLLEFLARRSYVVV